MTFQRKRERERGRERERRTAAPSKSSKCLSINSCSSYSESALLSTSKAFVKFYSSFWNLKMYDQKTFFISWFWKQSCSKPYLHNFWFSLSHRRACIYRLQSDHQFLIHPPKMSYSMISVFITLVLVTSVLMTSDLK